MMRESSDNIPQKTYFVNWMNKNIQPYQDLCLVRVNNKSDDLKTG